MPPDPPPTFGLLGPLKVTGAPPLTPKQALLLTGLLFGDGETVSTTTLGTYVWGTDQPNSTAARLRSLVTELRRALTHLGDDLITTRAPGYAVDLSTHTTDIAHFHDHTTQAHRTGDPHRALHHLDRALALWRGPALTGLDTPPARAEAARLDEQRLSTMEARADIMLDLGRHRELVGDLTALTNTHPGRERPHAQLIIALHRCGRTEEALDTYHRLRTHLADDLGLEPSPELRDLHRAVLTTDPALTTPRTDRVPRRLPPDTTAFAGRETELDALTTAADHTHLIAVTGPAGAGKTTLTVHWAHRTTDRYPDGHLHLDMRGFDPGPPRTADDHIPGILRDLGIPAAAIPATTDERRALLRTSLTGRRILIICDNVADPDQVRPLIPTEPGSLLIATSRDRLTGLAALDGAHRIPLDALDPTAALDVLAHITGRARLDGDPHAATTLTELCGRLPLALRIAAARLADNPHQSLAHFTRTTAEAPLDALRVPGDPRADVRRTLTLSYNTLTPEAQRLFRLAAVIPTPAGLTTAAAHAITDHDPRTQLAELTARHLLTPTGDDRHIYHDLLRELGAELATTDPDHHTATTRLLDHHLHTPATHTDLPNLIAAAHHAITHGPHDLAWRLVEHIEPLTSDQPPTPTWHTLVHAALDTADPQGTAAIHHVLGIHHRRTGDLDTALHHFHTALQGQQDTGDHIRETRTHQAIGTTHFHAGRFTEAITHWTRALHHAHTHGDTTTQTTALNNIAAANGRLGDHDASIRDLTTVAALALDNGDTTTRAIALTNIAFFQRDQGDHPAAIANLTEAARLHHDNGSTGGQANAHCGLGLTHLDAGDHDAAAHHLRTALDHATRHGDHKLTVYVLCALARHALATDDPTRATALTDRAETHLAHTPGKHCNYAIALTRARTAQHTGDHHTAHHHATDAVNLAGEQPTDLAAAQALRAETHLALGDPDAAHHDATAALTVQTRHGHHHAAAETRRTLDHAHTMRETGTPAATI